MVMTVSTGSKSQMAKQPEKRCGNCRWWWHPKCVSIGSILNGCGNEKSEKYAGVTRDTETCPGHERKETADGEATTN
jgi:hypothetical protein